MEEVYSGLIESDGILRFVVMRDGSRYLEYYETYEGKMIFIKELVGYNPPEGLN